MNSIKIPVKYQITLKQRRQHGQVAEAYSWMAQKSFVIFSYKWIKGEKFFRKIRVVTTQTTKSEETLGLL